MTIAIIGGGNMGGAIARGLAAGSIVAAGDIVVSDRNENALRAIRDFNPDIVTVSDNREAVKDAGLVIIAVKPWLLEEVAAGIKDLLDYRRQSIASVVAGVDFATLGRIMDNGSGEEPVMYRIIPNTAVSIGRSVTFIASRGASHEQAAVVETMFSELGTVFMIEEDMMIAGTSLGSCGIAFALKYMDASIQGGIELGFSPETSREIVMKTVGGALGLLETYGTMPQTEIDKVTTPGGITLKGLEAMAGAGFEESVLAGLVKCR